MPKPTPAQLLARRSGKQPESVILDQVRQYLRLRGWLVFRHQQGLGAHKGFPDLTALKGGVTLYIEVRTPPGRLSEHQERFRAGCEAAGGRYIVARCLEDVMEVAA